MEWFLSVVHMAVWAALVFYALREMERKRTQHNFWRTAYCLVLPPIAWAYYRCSANKMTEA